MLILYIEEFEKELYAIEHSDLIDERIKRKYTDSPTSDTQWTEEADMSLELSDEKMSPNKELIHDKIELTKGDTFDISPDTPAKGDFISSNAIVNAYSKFWLSKARFTVRSSNLTFEKHISGLKFYASFGSNEKH